MPEFFSDQAIIKDCNFGEGVQVWHFCNLYGCSIDNFSKVGSYTEIQSNVSIGKNSNICSHSFICSNTTIGDDVFIGHGVMTINDLYPPSFKRTGSKDGWKSITIGDHVTVGTHATLFPVTIGDHAVIGAGAVVTKDVPPGAVVVGNPAKIIKYKDEINEYTTG
ncbi:MAG: acyltransferase [Candidatus Margulisiibacteriota bacterium]